MNKIIKAYIDSIDTAISVDKNNSIALKVSSFGNIDFLKEMNQIQYDLLLLEENINLNYNELKQIFSEQKLNLKFSEEDIQQIKALFDGKISAYDLSIFKMILEKNLPVLKIIYNAYSWDSKKIDEINEFNLSLGTRLQQVFNHALEKKCLLFIDAEQTYIQNYIDYIVAYYSIQMNKASAVVAQTLQCYLKKHEQNLNKWIQFSKKNQIKIGLKVVRGAYKVEEDKIAENKGISSLICNEIEYTHKNYNNSIQKIFEIYENGDKICFATHNIESLKLVGKFQKEYNFKNNIFCAQLLGISQHATGVGKELNLKLAKYVPFGNFEILIPYLMRRAEESAMIQKLKIQNELLNKELMTRMKFI